MLFYSFTIIIINAITNQNIYFGVYIVNNYENMRGFVDEAPIIISGLSGDNLVILFFGIMLALGIAMSLEKRGG